MCPRKNQENFCAACVPKARGEEGASFSAENEPAIEREDSYYFDASGHFTHSIRWHYDGF
jgi:hypothetical protein